MKLQKLLFLLTITAAVLSAAYLFWQDQAPKTLKEKALLFPNLSEQINNVKIVEIKGYEENVILSHQSNQWLVQSSDNFPALSEKVRKMIISLAELIIDSGKTKNPELYSKLAVEGPYDRKTQSKLVSLLDENGNLIASLIVGKARSSNEAIPSLYVRLPEQKQALLVRGQLQISSQDRDWFEQNIIDLSSDEIKRISIQHPNENSFTLSRKEAGEVNFHLEELPEDKRPQSEVILNSMGSVLESVRAEGVRSIDSFDSDIEHISIEVQTFRGLIIHIRLISDDDKRFAHFRFAYDADETSETNMESKQATAETATPEEEVALLNQRMSAWVFQIPKFKYDDMTKKFEEFYRD